MFFTERKLADFEKGVRGDSGDEESNAHWNGPFRQWCLLGTSEWGIIDGLGHVGRLVGEAGDTRCTRTELLRRIDASFHSVNKFATTNLSLLKAKNCKTNGGVANFGDLLDSWMTENCGGVHTAEVD